MGGRIVLFGATGYTGRLTAEAMIERGLRPVLAARNRERLEAMAAELGEPPLEVALADVSDPSSVRGLVEPGDVLVTTVGPFVRFGAPAAASASSVGAHYIDSTGEPPFIREVFERYGPAAERAGSAMLTAFGYDWVPGNLAGALALDRAGEDATRVDVGYFATGKGDASSMSGGTKASLLAVMLEPSFAFRDGRLQTERGAKSMRSFRVGKRDLDAVSVGSSEHFALPRVAPHLREVNVYLGWFGPASKPLQLLSAGMSVGAKVPGVKSLWRAAIERLEGGSSGGPDAAKRARAGSHIVAIAYDSGGRELSEVHVSGVDGYTFTGRMLAWGAERCAAGALSGKAGALGPVEAFGLAELVSGCAQAGIAEEGTEVESPHAPLTAAPAS